MEQVRRAAGAGMLLAVTSACIGAVTLCMWLSPSAHAWVCMGGRALCASALPQELAHVHMAPCTTMCAHHAMRCRH